MDNQTRNHLNLQKHIADQDHIIRVRNAEITALRKRAEKAEQERDHARRERDSWRAQVPLADWEKELVQHSEQPRPLTPDAIEVALHDCMPSVALDRLSGTQVMRLAEDMHAALTEPPARPEGAVTLAARLDEAHKGGGDVQDEADRLYAMGVRATGAE